MNRIHHNNILGYAFSLLFFFSSKSLLANSYLYKCNRRICIRDISIAFGGTHVDLYLHSRSFANTYAYILTYSAYTDRHIYLHSRSCTDSRADNRSI